LSGWTIARQLGRPAMALHAFDLKEAKAVPDRFGVHSDLPRFSGSQTPIASHLLISSNRMLTLPC
jgi:hypothetical protein